MAHFERNVLARIPEQAKEEAVPDLKGIFAVRWRETVEKLAQELSGHWAKRSLEQSRPSREGSRMCLCIWRSPVRITAGFGLRTD